MMEEGYVWIMTNGLVNVIECFNRNVVGAIMVPEIGIGIGIGFLTPELESDESDGIGRIGSVTRIFLAEALFCSHKI
jgi:hypothetical protein